jgi:drug/metabolite transporter (DMT)-like permease
VNPGNLWIVVSLTSALLQASRIAVTKKLSLDFSPQALTFYTNLASLVLTLPLVTRFHNFPLDEPQYIGVVLAGATFSGLGGWSFTYAIKHSNISIVGPIMTFTPGFVVAIEWLLLEDAPSARRR